MLLVKSSSASVRTLSLRLAQGNSAHVRMDPVEEDRLTTEQTLGDGHRREADVQIFGEGGILEIRCLDGGPGAACRLEVNAAD